MNHAARVPELSEEHRWRIVLGRDERYDGAFVYGVRSTRIYCRPSCPSRKPGRAQVRFFPTPAAAEGAGFRPCRRCKPGQPLPPDPGVATVRAACRLLDSRADQVTALATLAARVGTTPHRLLRAFRRVLGLSPRQYRDERRRDRFKSQLKDGRRVSPALYEAGYGSTSRVYEDARAQLGMTPAAYRRGGPGARIVFTTTPCPLGWLLVAASERGICRVGLGDDASALEERLRAEFPAAEVAADRGKLKAWVTRIVAHLGGRAPHLDLPLDVRATAFQRRVWEALRKIPYGHTRSYSAVARALGAPGAARAVARACATNPVALLVPCHRVVCEDGRLGGYRWGAERKRALLEREGGARPNPLPPPGERR